MFFPFVTQCTKRKPAGVSLLLLDRSHIGPLSVPVNYAVCSRVALKVSPNLTKHWCESRQHWGRGADSCLSHSGAIASGISVDTARSRGALSGVQTALLPMIHAIRTPTQGAALLQVSSQRYLLTLSCTVTCSRPRWYDATCSTRWPRSVG